MLRTEVETGTGKGQNHDATQDLLREKHVTRQHLFGVNSKLQASDIVVCHHTTQTLCNFLSMLVCRSSRGWRGRVGR